MHDITVSNQNTSPPKSTAYFPRSMIYYAPGLNKYMGNRLPHWEADSVIYQVTFSQIDSIPQAKRDSLMRERKMIMEWALRENRPLTLEEQKRIQYLSSTKIEEYLTNCYGSCLLRDGRVAQLVKEILESDNGKSYLLHAWCIMPNHIHLIFELLQDTALKKTLHYWKSISSHRINKLLNRTGPLWHPDSYNHIIRTSREYYNQIWYVWNNPVKISTVGWPWRWKCIGDAYEQ